MSASDSHTRNISTRSAVATNNNNSESNFTIFSRPRPPSVPSLNLDGSASSFGTFSVSGLNSPKKEMSVPYQNIQSRVPQTFEGFQTKSMEITLIKDLLFIFQGIHGSSLKEIKSSKYAIMSTEFINPCIRQQALRLCSLGSYFKVIKNFVDKPMTGIMIQSFKHWLNNELREYYRIIALMHKAINQCKGSTADTPMTEEASHIGEEPSLFTLSVWTWDLKKRFEFLARLIKFCEKKKGGELCSALFPFSEHGCPVISSMNISLMSIICKPLYSTICEWILYGELEDPFGEFFIAADHSCRKEELWHSKYTMCEKMLPEFIPKKLANRILATGKNINFLKEICQNSAAYSGRDEIEKILKEIPVQCLFLQEDVILHQTINKAYETTSSMVLSVLMEQSRLVDHLNAIKKYLLLGQGDFIQYLLELIQFELSKPATKVFYHNLSSVLESAVRSTNAQFEDEEILSRLDIRLLPSTDKDVGWDVFCLDYKVQGPIGTVLSESVMGRYNQLFNTLWRTKRIEAILSTLWKNQTSLFKLQRVLPELGSVLHRSQLLISEMIHFVHQTQYYIMFEATECAWDRLMMDVAKSKDLDEVIFAHDSFLDTITKRSLLNGSSRDLLNQLRGIFDIVHEFKEFLTKFDHSVMIEYERRRKIKPQSPDQLREAQKEFFKKFVSNAKGKVETLYTSHQDLVRQFLLQLNKEQDLTLQCLSFRLDFNEYYQKTDPRLTQPLTYLHRRMSMGTGGAAPWSLDNTMIISSFENSFSNTISQIPEDSEILNCSNSSI